MANITTKNVPITLALNTNAILDVTEANLDADLSIKDFIVLHNGTPYLELNNYEKTTRNTLTYRGANLGTTLVEVRRKTPTVPVQTVQFGSKMSSDLWNKELERKSRWQFEADLNGTGATFTSQLATPDNSAYGSSWSFDTLRPPTRQAVYNKLETLAPINDPDFQGNPTSSTPPTDSSSRRIATTAYVKSNLNSYAPLNSPTFTGTPRANDLTAGTNDNSIANAKFVNAAANSIATTVADSRYKPCLRAFRNSSSVDLLNTYTVFMNDKRLDTHNAYTGTEGAGGTYTIPPGLGGVYYVELTVLLGVNNEGTDLAFSFASYLLVGGTIHTRLAQISTNVKGVSSTRADHMLHGSTIITLDPGNALTFTVSNFQSGATKPRYFVYGAPSEHFSRLNIFRLGAVT